MIMADSYDHTPPYMKLAEYFKTHSKEDLYDLKKSPYAYGHGLEGLTYYEAISHTPERLHMFNTTMVQMERQVPILGLFPFATLKDEVEAEKERPFVVDIGGGRGQALIAIQKEASAGFGGKMILQDRSDVLDTLTVDDIPNIEKMVYDFHTPQPVKSKRNLFFDLRRFLSSLRCTRIFYPTNSPWLFRPSLHPTVEEYRISNGTDFTTYYCR